MKTLQKLFLDALAEIYDAEIRLVGQLPKMMEAVTCTHLKEAIQVHLRETEEHVSRLKSVFDEISERPWRKTSEATISYLNESHEVLSFYKGHSTLHAAMIAVVQKIEHYKIASYGCLRDWAIILKHEESAALLQRILDESKATNQSLTDLARSRSNQEALKRPAEAEAETPPTATEHELTKAISRLETEAPTHGSPDRPLESTAVP